MGDRRPSLLSTALRTTSHVAFYFGRNVTVEGGLDTVSCTKSETRVDEQDESIPVSPD